MKKQRMIRSKGRTPYWGVIAPDPTYRTFHNPNNFMGLLQPQHQDTEVIPDSAQESIPGKEKTDQPSEDFSV